ncbi:MAG TPA: nickel pincer cofactor biosynthesis protein LarC, partial [Thermodesulfovibrionales bacterium]|nr:nickel pincer cofactor biosynthesis protein LarC [Thermodesulfovibrionales bacterium]
SGDMCLGALVDAGVPLEEMEKGLKRLPVKGFGLRARRVKRAGIAATKVDVLIRDSGNTVHPHRTWKDIKGIVDSSLLPAPIRRRGLKIFRTLFEAEGKVHGTPYHRTHLHELGAVDCMVDVFGTLIGLAFLEAEKVYSSAVNLGSGSVVTEHGRLPVPAPATLEIVKGMPVRSSEASFELTTPTGAAILKGIADGFVGLPLMKIGRIGYGAGQRDRKGSPNALRIMVGEEIASLPAEGLFEETASRIVVIETNIDDMNPQIYDYVMERLFEAGALDVYLNQIIMKKSRPAVVLTVLCDTDKSGSMIDILLKETSTIGVRFHAASRFVLDREIREVRTAFGKIRFKTAKLADGTVKYAPEYEDCKRAAKKYKLPLRVVIARAVASRR